MKIFKTKSILKKMLLTGLAFQSLASFAQEGEKTFEEIVKEKEAYYQTHGKGKGSGYKQFKRWEELTQTHTLENGQIADIKFLTQQAYEQEQLKIGRQRRTTTSQTNKWESIGPYDFSGDSKNQEAFMGRVNEIAVDPNNSDILYAATPGGGLWKKEGAANWIPLTDNLPMGIQLSSVVVDPNDSKTIYVLTGDANGSGINNSNAQDRTGGVLVTNDGGNTWSLLSNKWGKTPISIIANKILLSKVNSKHLLMVTNSGLYKWNEVEWTLKSTGNFTDITYKPNSNNVIYATTAHQSYVSNDAGETWNALTGQPHDFDPIKDRYSAPLLGVTKANPEYLYILSNNGVYISTNGGTSFVTKRIEEKQIQENGDTLKVGWFGGMACLAVSPTDPTKAIVGNVGLFQLTNSGEKITPIVKNGANLHPDQHFAMYHGSDLYLANDGGVYKSSDEGVSWENISQGLQISESYRINVTNQDPNLVISGVQDNGTYLVKNNEIKSHVEYGDGFACFFELNDPNIAYYSIYYYLISRKEISSNSTTKLLDNIQGSFFTYAFVHHPTKVNTIYYGVHDLFKSVDQGDNWKNISNGKLDASEIREILVAPSNDKVIYVIQNNVIYKTTNEGNTWVKLSIPGVENINRMTIDPLDENRIWVACSGYSTSKKVYKSENGGQTWQNQSLDLPNLPINTIVYQKGSNDGIYIGNDLGVYYKDNSLSDWSFYSNNLPKAMAYDLQINYTSNKLVLGTYGRGIWQIDLYNVTHHSPSIELSSQQNEEQLIITTSITDQDNDINYVEYYNQDNVFLAKVENAPYNLTIPNTSFSDFIYAHVFDKTGLDAFSNKIYKTIPSTQLSNVTPELSYSYYEGNWDNLPNFTSLTSVKTGKVNNFDISVKNRNDNFAIEYTGYIKIEKEGKYTFYAKSDDGSKMYVAGKEVVDNDGLHGSREKNGVIALASGYHPITVGFFEGSGGEVLDVSYQGPNIDKQIIPASVLFSGEQVQQGCDATSYVANSSYATGQEVENDGTKYECKVAGWCSSASAWAYEPGVGSYWEQAWVEVGPCASGPINPTVSLTKPITNAILGSNKGHNFTVNAQDADGTVSQVVYDFTTPSGQKLQGGSAISPFTITYGFSEIGTHQVTVTATDNEGNVGTTTSSFIVVDGTPTISITSPTSGTELTAGVATTFNVNAQDQDGVINKVKYVISAGGPAATYEVTNAPFSLDYTPISNGNITVQAIAYDNDGKTGQSTSISYVVVAAVVKPTISFTSPSLNTIIYNNHGYDFAVNAQDADGSVSEVTYEFTGANNYQILLNETNSSTGFSVNWGFINTGVYQLKATAIDNDGNETSITKSINVVSGYPTISFTVPSTNTTIYDKQGYDFAVNAQDPNGSVVEVTYEFTGANNYQQLLTSTNVNTGFSLNWGFINTGVYQLKATAIDNDGNETSITKSINVVSGTPTLTITSPANGTTLYKGISSLFTVNAQDPNGTIATVDYYFRDGGAPTVYSVSNAPFSLDYIPTLTGTMDVDVIAIDNDNRSITKTVTITIVENEKPTVVITSPSSGSSFASGTVVNVTVNAQDTDGTITKVELYSSPNTLLGTKTTTPYTFALNLAEGNHGIFAKAYDNANGISSTGFTGVEITGGSVCTIPEWVSSKSYSTGNLVSYDGQVYEAAFWSNGSNPSTNNGVKYSGQPWIIQGPCGASAGAEPIVLDLTNSKLKTELVVAPNPFTTATNILFVITEKTNVELTIYTLQGKKVATLINTTLEEGEYTYEFAIETAGTYVVKLIQGDKLSTQMLIKQ